MIKIIVAMDKKRGIGIENHLPWSIPEDLKEFKRLTLGHSVLMGRKTLESIGKALPGRTNYVITHQNILPFEDVTLVHDVQSFLESKKASRDLVYVIGGASLYQIALAYADELIISEVQTVFLCDTYFPPFNSQEFCLNSEVAYAEFIQKRYVRILR